MKDIIDLKRLKEIQVDMLKAFDTFCKDNSLTYFLTYGTLIGALRHKGYIPWDDDIDLMMPRKDYNRLISHFNTSCTDMSLRVIEHSIDSQYYLPFAKLVNSKTVLKENVDNDYEIGIYIDIFPLDNLSDDFGQAKKVMKKAFRFNRRLQFKTISLTKKRSLIKNVILIMGKTILHFQNISHILSSFDNFCQSKMSDRFTKYVGVMTGTSAGDESRVFRKEWFENVEYAWFENQEYPVPIGADALLKQLYGDYMTPPPKDQQVTHHSFEAWYK